MSDLQANKKKKKATAVTQRGEKSSAGAAADAPALSSQPPDSDVSPASLSSDLGPAARISKLALKLSYLATLAVISFERNSVGGVLGRAATVLCDVKGKAGGVLAARGG